MLGPIPCGAVPRDGAAMGVLRARTPGRVGSDPRCAPGSAARASQAQHREMPLGGWAEEEEEEEEQTTG